jgi:hydrogenase expression/formation protein HypE
MKENKIDLNGGFSCPIPISEYKEVLLAHGSGGKLSHQMILKLFASQFKNDLLAPLHDGAMIQLGNSRIAYSTDSYVIDPIFFPGGDIGALAVNGTVNDLSMCGAKPLYLSSAFIIEEGLLMEDLWRIIVSMEQRKTGGQNNSKRFDRSSWDSDHVRAPGTPVRYGDNQRLRPAERPG